MNRILASLWLAAAAASTTGVAMAGKIAEPDELRYPNVISPRLEIVSRAYDTAGLLGSIEGVTFLDDGRFLVSASTGPQLAMFDAANGALLRAKRFEGEGYRLRGIAYARDSGTIYAVESSQGQLLAFDENFELRKRYRIPVTDPVDVTVIGGKAYVTDENAGGVVTIDLDSGDSEALTVAANDLPLRLAHGIASSGDYLAVADAGNDRLIAGDIKRGAFFEIGKGWGSYGGQLATPIDLSIADGKLFVADQINHRIQVFSQDGQFLFQWARHPPTAHEGNGRVHYPGAIGVSPSGRDVVVCEPIENRCQIFGMVAIASRVVDSNETAWWDKATRFHYGKRPTVSANMLAISEPDTHSVLVFKVPEPGNPMRPEFITRIGSRGKDPGFFLQPSGLLLDAQAGTILVSDRGNLRVQEFSIQRDVAPPQAQVETSTSTGTGAMPMGSGSNKFLRAMSFRRGDGMLEAKTRAPKVGEPSAMARLPDGRILLLDPALSRVHIVDGNMRILGSWGEKGNGPAQLVKPMDLGVSPDGKRVYVVDEYAFTIKVFTPDGRFLFSWGGPGDRDDQFVTPFGIAIAGNGDVFVSDTATNSIRKFTADGKYVTRWGAWGVAPGEFYKPKGLAIDQYGRLFVMDFGNHRGQVFDLDGKFISMFGISDKKDEINLKY